MNKKSAFTLAEVLITLGVIGVVAAMTLPNLISNFQEKALVTQVKKTYSSLENAFNMHRAQSGEDNLSGIFDTSNTDDQTRDALAKYFNVVAKCRFGEVNGCSGHIKEKQMKANRAQNGKSQMAADWSHISRFVTNNGAIIGVTQYPSCNQEYPEVRDAQGNLVGNAWTRLYCAVIYIDVNGAKGPNQAGRDFFQLITNAQGGIIYGVVTDNSGDIRSVLLTDKLNDTKDYDPNADYTP